MIKEKQLELLVMIDVECDIQYTRIVEIGKSVPHSARKKSRKQGRQGTVVYIPRSVPPGGVHIYISLSPRGVLTEKWRE